MITQLQLNNFKRHRTTSLTFDPGITALTGLNGAGKSTVLKGILLALLGNAHAGSKEHFTSWGSDKKYAVALHTSVPRFGAVTITRDAVNATVYGPDNATPLASSHSAVTKFIEECYGMPAKALKTLIYSPQGEAQALLNEGALALQRKVEELARIGQVDEVLKRVADSLKDATVQHAAVVDRLDQIDAAHKQMHAVQVDLAGVQFERRTLGDRYTEIEGKLHLLTEQGNKLRGLQAEYVDVQHGIHGKEADLSYLKEALDGARCPSQEAINGLWEQYTQANEAFITYDNQLNTYRLLQARRERLNQTIEQEQAFVVESRKAEQELREQGTRTSFLQGRIDDTRFQLEALRQEMDKLDAFLASGECHACHRPFEGVTPEQIKDAEVRRDEMQASRKETKARLAQLENDLADARKQEHALTARLDARAPERLQQARQALAELDVMPEPVATVSPEDVQELKRSLATAQNLAEQHASTVKAITSVQELLRLSRGRLQEISEEITKLHDALEPLIPQGYDLAAYTAEVARAKQDLLTELTTAAQQEGALQNTLQGLKDTLRGEDDFRARQSALAARVDVLTRLADFIRTNRSRIFGETWDALLGYTGYLIEQVTKEGGTSHLSGLTRIDGEFHVQDNGRLVPVDELSGGYRSIVGACLRVAMSKVFYGDGLPLLLDEVSSDLTEDLAGRLTAVLAGAGPQIIMVTHREGDTLMGKTIEVTHD